MNYDNVLFLTACVNPNGMAYTALQDKNIRLQQYKETLNWYLKNFDIPILVVENTLTDFSVEYQSYIDSGRLEFLTFDGNNFDKSKGKGYGEALIIKFGIEHSEFLSKAVRVTKITGRLKIKTMGHLLKEALVCDDIYANIELVKGHCLCLSFLFIAPVEYLRSCFLTEYDKIDDSKGYYFEHLLFDTAVSWVNKGHKIRRFIFPIDVIGISGSSGKAYGRPKFMYVRSFVKYMLYKMNLYYFDITK